MAVGAQGPSLGLQDPVGPPYQGGPLVAPFTAVAPVVHFHHAESPGVPYYVVGQGVPHWANFPRPHPLGDTPEVHLSANNPGPPHTTFLEVQGPADYLEAPLHTKPPVSHPHRIPQGVQIAVAVLYGTEHQGVPYQGNIPGALPHTGSLGLLHPGGYQEALAFADTLGRLLFAGCQRVHPNAASLGVHCHKDQSLGALQAVLFQRAQVFRISLRAQKPWEDQEDYPLLTDPTVSLLEFKGIHHHLKCLIALDTELKGFLEALAGRENLVLMDPHSGMSLVLDPCENHPHQ